MKPSEINDKYFATGNRGHVFVDHEVHIAKKGMDPNTLCGIPMLFNNYVPKDETKDNLGICKECMNSYTREVGAQVVETNDNQGLRPTKVELTPNEIKFLLASITEIKELYQPDDDNQVRLFGELYDAHDILALEQKLEEAAQDTIVGD